MRTCCFLLFALTAACSAPPTQSAEVAGAQKYCPPDDPCDPPPAACDPGIGSCNGGDCDTNLNTDANNCGACGRVCPHTYGGSVVWCSAGQCQESCPGGQEVCYAYGGVCTGVGSCCYYFNYYPYRYCY
jgi:hypothetical protein